MSLIADFEVVRKSRKKATKKENEKIIDEEFYGLVAMYELYADSGQDRTIYRVRDSEEEIDRAVMQRLLAYGYMMTPDKGYNSDGRNPLAESYDYIVFL